MSAFVGTHPSKNVTDGAPVPVTNGTGTRIACDAFYGIGFRPAKFGPLADCYMGPVVGFDLRTEKTGNESIYKLVWIREQGRSRGPA